MACKDLLNIDLSSIKTPYYLLDDKKIESNARILEAVIQATGCSIILALKAFATVSAFEMLRPYLSGCAASSLNEAKLAKDYFGKYLHVYSAAYRKDEIGEIVSHADYITFNSLSQWQQYRGMINMIDRTGLSAGLRINPEHSETKTLLYDPCRQYSRFGVTKRELDQVNPACLQDIEGLHVHALCGSHFEALKRMVACLEEQFSSMLHHVKWLNLGGGHLITDPDYDRQGLCDLITRLQDTYQVHVILEPGEAVVYQAGYLITTVLDIHKNEKEIIICDTSATTHMPDIIEMPYQPSIQGASINQDKAYSYIVGGVSCLSGDIMGEYHFDKPINSGDILIFKDMAQYTMVKNTQFNGINLPGIAHLRKDSTLEKITDFSYEFYEKKLAPSKASVKV